MTQNESLTIEICSNDMVNNFQIPGRKKRSLEKIYDMFKAVKKATVDKIVEIEVCYLIIHV